MSGRSAKEAMEKIRERAVKAFERARDVVHRGDPAEAPLGEGAAERARRTLRSRGDQLDAQIEREGG